MALRRAYHTARHQRARIGLQASILALCAVMPGQALLLAQPVVQSPVVQNPVVQALPQGSASQALNGALGRLARDPRDLDALIDAGKAALAMGDIDAAIGFFARADQLSPNNMRVKAGLAGAMVRSENPYDAIPLFAEADKAGALDALLTSDRGLAYDLVGDNETAQRYYRAALAQAPNDETVRRLALSQAIAGDRSGMETTLSPLLQRQDKAGWRIRTFGLAILQQPEEAVAIAHQTMPEDLAESIAPYLRYMPRLTAAQQAAAANFGRFPRAAEIGRDDPRVALYAPPKRVATLDSALAPTGKPLGRAKGGKPARDDQRGAAAPAAASAAMPAAPVAQPVRSAPPEPVPMRQVTPAPALAAETRPAAASVPPSSALAAAAPAIAAPATSSGGGQPVAGSTAGSAQVALAPPAPPAQPLGLVSGGGFDLARVEPSRAGGASVGAASTLASPVPAANPVLAGSVTNPPVAPAPVPATSTLAASGQQVAQPVSQSTAQPVSQPAHAAVPVVASAVPAVVPPPARAAVLAAVAPPAAPRRRVADAFAEFSTVSKAAATPAPGAVDVRKLPAAKPKPVEPPKPVHPSRVWVQVGTGRDLKAMGFTWRGLVKDRPELFKGKAPSTSDWGRTNRLLTGPFASESAAQAFLAKLKKAELDAFLWISPAGQAVDDLPSR